MYIYLNVLIIITTITFIKHYYYYYYKQSETVYVKQNTIYFKNQTKRHRC